MILVLSLIILSDRLLLVKFGNTLWEFDPQLYYKHIPNIVRNWGPEFNNKLIKINSLGFHDDEISIDKLPGEFRIFVLGNSITMGHGVTKDETFSNQLEKRLNKVNYIKKFKRFQVINMGVQGYSTYQELEMLKRYWKLKPDLILISFCLNDVTEPFDVLRKFGGTGFDYHQVDQSEEYVKNYFFNKTGYGKLINHLKFRNKIKSSKQKELKEVYDLCKNSFDYSFIKKWKIILKDLEEIYTISKNNNIPIILLIFPYTFQFFRKDLQSPQKILINDSNKFNIKYINFNNIFEDIILSRKHVNESIKQSKDRFNKYYYLDEDHLSTYGHKLVSKIIFPVVKKYISFMGE